MKYKPGDRVKTNLWGKRMSGLVLECINADDSEDVKAQGYRYYVRLGKSRHVYSVTQKYLWV